MIKFTKSKIAGFTLVEILIAMGICAGVMLGIVQFAVKSVKTSKGQTLDYEFTVLSSNVGNVLESDCDRVLAGQTITAGNNVSLVIPSSPVTYTVASTTYPANFEGVRATSITITSLSAPIFHGVSSNRDEVHATLNLQAKRFLANGTIEPGSPNYTKDFKIDAWVDPANLVLLCQKQPPPANATLSFTTTPPASSCLGDPPITGHWSVSNPARNAFFAVTPSAPPPIPDIQALPTAASSGPFTIPIPSVPGTYTYTLFIEDLAGRSSWASTTAKSFTLNVFASGAGTPPCP